jgi:hypothetical protein
MLIFCDFTLEFQGGKLEMNIEFIKPRNTKKSGVDWEISERTRTLIKYYAEYTEYSESEVVDQFLTNILKDEKFIDWILKKRNNKRILAQLDLQSEESKIG